MRRSPAAALAASLALLAGADVALAKPQPNGQFSVRCQFSHRAADDPIVAPGNPGASHSHDFVGNRSTNAASTHASLLEGATNCRRQQDRSAYWAPTLYLLGRELAPHHAQIYYLTAGRDPASIQAFPAGLMALAGVKGTRAARWSCAPGALRRTRLPKRRSDRARRAQRDPAKAPMCRRNEHIKATISFGDCWNGKDLDSPDHHSHLAYSKRRSCPETHPVAVPALRLNLHYPTRLGTLTRLSSGGTETMHADFFNAWQPGALEDLVRRCLNAAVRCGGR